MDGGGNDCLIANNGDAALPAATSLFKTMADNKVEKVAYFFYPDANNNSASLLACINALRPKIKSLCEELTAPKCYFLDLNPLWKPEYFLSDGIHPTDAGSTVAGNAIWEMMVANCIAQ